MPLRFIFSHHFITLASSVILLYSSTDPLQTSKDCKRHHKSDIGMATMTSRIETTPASLNPTRILYLEYKHHGKGTTRVSDLTNQLDPFYSPATGLHEDFLKEAKSIADSLDSPLQALYIFKKENILGSKVTIKDAEGNTVAEESNPVLSSGKARFTFPKQSLHSSHDVEIKPVGFMNSAESFVKDGVNYFWEIEEHQLERRIMSKVDSLKPFYRSS
jgi:hypothetical protein